jgi:hypothetical protein
MYRSAPIVRRIVNRRLGIELGDCVRCLRCRPAGGAKARRRDGAGRAALSHAAATIARVRSTDREKNRWSRVAGG